MALAVGAAAALSACVPAPHGSYLRPDYPDPSSRISRGTCGGQAGPPSRLEFTGPGKVLFNVSGWRPQGAKDPTAWYVTIAVKPPPQSGFRFVTDLVRIGSSADALDEPIQPSVYASTFQAIPAGGWVDVDTLGPTSRELATRALARQPAQASIELQAGPGMLPGTPQRLRVVLPAVATARERYAVPPQDLGGDAATSNASYSFRQVAGPFTWMPRFRSDPGGTAPTLHFELTVRARTAEPWRLADPLVRTTDPGGQARDETLGQVRVSLHYPVPLDAGLRGANPSLSVTVPLAQPRARTFIQLPLYDVEGQRHQLRPIELQLRRLDAGQAPLDC